MTTLPVWIYWEGEMPDWISDCHRTIFQFAGDVRLITPSVFDSLRDKDRDIDLSCLCIAHRADFIRAFLLARFGGIWIDSDCIVMKPLQPLFEKLEHYDFIAFRQRDGSVSNSFIGTKENGIIARLYYETVCRVLRSGQPIEWLSIGSQALMSAMQEAGAEWYEIDCALIQPVCWSTPGVFFETGTDEKHLSILNRSSFCYMLSGSMIKGITERDPSQNILHPESFFSFLLRQSDRNKRQTIMQKMHFRKNTDDDAWVIPEVITHDMYRVKDVLSALQPDEPAYILDCGAHIGAFSVMCAEYLGRMNIISFEPNPASFHLLSQNAALYPNITPVNKAIDVVDGTLELFAPAQDDWTGRWSAMAGGGVSIATEAVSLFEFIKQLDKPVFIVKLDLEGYEELILNNAEEKDLEKVQILIIETHSDNLDHDRLTGFGYELLFQPHISTQRQFVYRRIK